MKKIMNFLFFFVLSYYLYIELGQRPRQIYRYVDIQMPIDGAEGLKAVGLMGLKAVGLMGLSGGADGADHNKK